MTSEMWIRAVDSKRLELIAHNPFGGLVAACFGTALYRLVPAGSGFVGLAGKAFLAIIAVLGAAGVLWRDRLTFDATSRTWRRVHGLWPMLETVTGSFDTLEGISVTKAYGRHRGKAKVEWEVWICSSDAAAAVRILESDFEDVATRERDRCARALGLKTGGAFVDEKSV